jgi:hypothetical protein
MACRGHAPIGQLRLFPFGQCRTKGTILSYDAESWAKVSGYSVDSMAGKLFGNSWKSADIAGKSAKPASFD